MIISDSLSCCEQELMQLILNEKSRFIARMSKMPVYEVTFAKPLLKWYECLICHLASYEESHYKLNVVIFFVKIVWILLLRVEEHTGRYKSSTGSLQSRFVLWKPYRSKAPPVVYVGTTHAGS